MEIEAAMREARGLHQFGYASLFKTLLAKAPRRRFENALARRIHMSFWVTQVSRPLALLDAPFRLAIGQQQTGLRHFVT